MSVNIRFISEKMNHDGCRILKHVLKTYMNLYIFSTVLHSND